jgi:membrane-bound lytic murein transglycosylase B
MPITTPGSRRSGAVRGPRGSPRPRSTAASRGKGFLPGVVERDRNQTEFRRTTEDYLALVASEEDVALGRSRVGPVRS